ncbi:hypothetical protein SO802_007008 [Lithocarpus litseifolius]|uniref:Reverse transcriptase zinc-binding domain-containing protein n=1 Tax=Lithocarpus litseifolius TaxID=425828 RepID=A0AAW2DRF4_9ROSI
MNKLSGWKAKFLSLAGRAVLIKSVMSTIPNHIMQGVALPTHICDKLDKVNRDFLWGSTTERRKLHLVGWNKIVKPKEDGGLGIQAAKAKNLALLAKLNWRLYQEKDALWTQVILKKYCSPSRVRARDPDALPSSPNWKAIKVGFPIFSSGICWCVGTGARTKVWLDRWLKGESLREIIQGPLSLRDNSLTMEELRDVGGWKWDLISFDLPDSIKNKIKALPLQEFGHREDSIMWKYTRDGDFSTNSAYLLSSENESTGVPFMGKWIWKIDILPKIIMFLWLCFHNSVPVKSILATRGINCDGKCPICRSHDESIVHLLRDCKLVHNYWRSIEVPPECVNTFTGSLEGWLQSNSVNSVLHRSGLLFVQSASELHPLDGALQQQQLGGVLVYSIDESLIFDPTDLDIDVTPEAVDAALNEDQQNRALILSLRLNEDSLIKKCIFAISPVDIPAVASSIPYRYL